SPLAPEGEGSGLRGAGRWPALAWEARGLPHPNSSPPRAGGGGFRDSQVSRWPGGGPPARGTRRPRAGQAPTRDGRAAPQGFSPTSPRGQGIGPPERGKGSRMIMSIGFRKKLSAQLLRAALGACVALLLAAPGARADENELRARIEALEKQ